MRNFLASHNKSRHHQCNHQSKLAAFIQRFIAWENIFTKNSFCNHRRTELMLFVTQTKCVHLRFDAVDRRPPTHGSRGLRNRPGFKIGR